MPGHSVETLSMNFVDFYEWNILLEAFESELSFYCATLDNSPKPNDVEQPI